MARGRRSGRGRAGRGGEVRRSAGVCVMWRPARVRGACRRGGFRGPAGGARGFEVAGNRRPTPGAGAGARGTVTSTASRDGRHARAPAHFTVWERSGVEVEPSSRATAMMRQRAGDASTVGFARAVPGALDGGVRHPRFRSMDMDLFVSWARVALRAWPGHRLATIGTDWSSARLN